MDPEIWSRLPEDLLEHVLLFLPLKNFLVLRSTCKHFKSLLSSPSFVSKHSPPSSPFSSFLLLSHRHFHGHFPLFDTTLYAWRKLSLCLSSAASASASLLSVSRGLLCFSLPNSPSFLVCNLLSRTSRLVKFPTTPFAFELLTLISTPTGFTLFMLCSSSAPPASNTAFVYDSKLQLWHKFDGVDSILSNQEGVPFKGCLYFTTPEPFSILVFDLGTGEWRRPMADLPADLSFVRLVSDGGENLYLVGGIGQNGISRKMKLWELGRGGERWVELGSVPEMMCRKFTSVCYHNYEHVYCVCHQGMVCVCCYTWPEVLYYKVSRRTWHWVVKCPALPERWSCGFRWFSLVPELHAFV